MSTECVESVEPKKKARLPTEAAASSILLVESVAVVHVP